MILILLQNQVCQIFHNKYLWFYFNNIYIKNKKKKDIEINV